MKIEVSIEGAHFFAFHGFHEEERKVGNTFIVDIKVIYDYKNTSDKLTETLDYGLLHQYAKQSMETPVALLETVAESIMTKIFHNHHFVLSAEVSVSKMNPPLGAKVDRSKVVLRKHR